MSETVKTGPTAGGTAGRTNVRARRVARLAAVQALYQVHLSGATSAAVLADFEPHRLAQDQEGIDLAEADRDFLRELVEGVLAEETALDDMLTAVLAEDWPVERLEILLRVILRAGTFELAYREDIPPRVTITEYVPDQRVVYEAVGSAGTIRHSFALAPADGGVQVTKGCDVVQAKFPFSIFAPIVTTFLTPGNLQGDLQRIKEKIEGA